MAASAAPIILNIVMIGILFLEKFLGEKLVIYLFMAFQSLGSFNYFFNNICKKNILFQN